MSFEKGSKSVLNAWAFYDWANSVYSLVITSSIFPLFYGALFRLANKDGIEIGGQIVKSESVISYVTAIGFLIVAILSPILSGIADYLGNKKFFLKLFCFIGSVSCMLLYFFTLENAFLGLLTYMIALIGFWGSLVFYNSYLPDIALESQQDKISAKGYALGYVGSVVLLLLNLFMVLKYDIFGFENELAAMRVSFLMVGIWWLGFAQISYRKLPDFKNDKKLIKSVVFSGFKELRKVWQQLQTQHKLKKYLLAFFVYSMGVQTVMIAAAYFGEKEIDWGSDSKRTFGLITTILLIQLIAVVGAILTARASKKFGNIPTLIAINVFWLILCSAVYFVKTPNEFYIVAAFVGLVMGGVQSLSRSTYSKLLPETEDTTSYFSFYDVAEKIGIVIGMFMYGFVTDQTGRVQNAILFLVVFFLIGIVILTFAQREKRTI
jgi:UMF1 family MFS transporter